MLNERYEQCPACMRVVNCLLTSCHTEAPNGYLEYQHPECGTKWRQYLNEDKPTILKQVKRNAKSN